MNNQELAMPSWNPDLYLQFANERNQPILDLVARIHLADPRRIIDLGCGPGNSTALLHQRWPEADTTGLDNSPDMLAAAAKAYPPMKWQEGDAGTWTADVPFDLVFSNAALQWVPDHATVLPRLLEQAGQPGALAVQMPLHFESPVHQLILEIARDPAWRHCMEQAVHAIRVERPGFYYDLLQPHAARLDLWETIYHHILDGPQAIVDWIRGTGLRPFLQALPDEGQKSRFLELLLAGVTEAYPRQKDGRVLFPFRRLFLVAYR
jgi:trans-aconitate 2-methyltransferase